MSVFLTIIFWIVLLCFFVLWGIKSAMRSLFSGSGSRPGWQTGTRTAEGASGSRNEGKVTIRMTSAPQPKRVRKDVGDYVDYEEEKPDRSK